MDNPALVTGAPSRLINVNWNLDKYPDAPEFDARAKLTVLDADGPAMITNIHATAYYQKNDWPSPKADAAKHKLANL